MKAKELMIGDWVRPLKKKLKGIPGKVITIDGGTDVCWIDSKDYSCLVPCSDVERIPITPEILEKNGFENDFYEDESVADYVKVRLEGYSLRCKANGWDDALVTWCNGHLEVVTDFNGEVRKDIDHVHQLQHALRICGIDKEIVVC